MARPFVSTDEVVRLLDVSSYFEQIGHPGTRRRQEIDDARPHGGALTPTRAINPVLEMTAHAICKAVYGGAYVCERQRVPICATIEGEAARLCGQPANAARSPRLTV